MSSTRALAVLLSLPPVVAACGDNIEVTPDAGPAAVTVISVAGDYQTTGALSRIALPSLQVERGAVSGVAGLDPVIRHLGNELFVINRADAANITILDAATLTLVQQISTGGGSYPQDVAVVGRKLYVAALSSRGILVIDRDRPSTIDVIDLADFDPDGAPDCNSVYAVADRVYAVCGQIDNAFQPRGPGKAAVIDARTDTVVVRFELATANPVGQLEQAPELSRFGGDLLIGGVPDYLDSSKGCVARIHVGAAPGPNGCAVTNAALGGYVNHLALSPDGAALYFAVASFAGRDFTRPQGMVVGLDLTSGELGTAITSAGVFAIDVTACPDGYVVVADRTPKQSGLRVFRHGRQLTTGPLDVGFPPAYGSGLVCW